MDPSPDDPSNPLAPSPVLQVSCTLCRNLHRASSALEFHPVCADCAEGSPTLRLLQMDGVFPLTGLGVDAVIGRKSPGNFALGFLDGAVFVVSYLGRSDADVGGRLHDWVGAPSRYRRYAPGGSAPWGFRRRGALPLGQPALDRVGASVDSSYTHFAYSYAASPEAAFELECRNYMDFGCSGRLDNEFPPSCNAL